MDTTRTHITARDHTGLDAFRLITGLLLIVGGLNWGLVGLFNFDLVAALFGDMTTASRIVYALVGAAALAFIFLLPRASRR
jgi:uncharacterized membrane protein YuzA (DUF378 family)